MSRAHKSSKRKDLAFINYTTNEEAKLAVDSFGNDGTLGQNVTISLAFSQQAMQNKKKIKECRKRGKSPPQNNVVPNIVNNNTNVNANAMLAMMSLFNMNKVEYILIF